MHSPEISHYPKVSRSQANLICLTNIHFRAGNLSSVTVLLMGAMV